MVGTLVRMPGRVPAPPRLHALLEVRAPAEILSFQVFSRLRRLMPRGDGHPVLVLPGFLGDDVSIAPLRKALRAQGFWVHGWGTTRNLGPHPATMVELRRRLLELTDRHQSKVSLVGYSMGGVLARELAREHPELVRRVVTLCSPFRFRPGDGTTVLDIYDQVRARWPRATIDFSDIPDWPDEHHRPPLEVDVTSIFSRSDGMIRAELCIEAEAPRRENIAVIGSHIGMPWNTAAFYPLVDRLALPEGEWWPFVRPPGSASIYPDVSWWRPRAEKVAA